jgi:hypothetical protein
MITVPVILFAHKALVELLGKPYYFMFGRVSGPVAPAGTSMDNATCSGSVGVSKTPGSNVCRSHSMIGTRYRYRIVMSEMRCITVYGIQ